MLFGVSQRNITPEEGIPVFKAHFKDPSNRRVLDDLYVRCLYLSQNAALLIVNLDLIWVSRGFSERIRKWAKETFNLAPSNILVSATHTHSSPQIRENTIDGGALSQTFLTLLEEKTKESITAAVQSPREGRMTFSTGEIRCSVNRRKKIIDFEALKRLKIEKRIANRPNDNGSVDRKFVALWIYDEAGHPKSVVLNFGCHASIYKKTAVSSDFPGYVAKKLAHRFGPDFFTFFLQGFSGNVRPRLITRTQTKTYHLFSRGFFRLFDPLQFQKQTDRKDLEHFADQVITDLFSMDEHQDLEPRFSAQIKGLRLKCDRQRPKAYFEKCLRSQNNLERDYAKYVLNNYENSYEMEFLIQVMTISEKLAIIAMEGEIFTEYALWLRSRYEKHNFHVMPVGCANGMVGYIPDKRSIKEGGYEPERSLLLFGLPDKLDPSTETRIRQEIHLLMDEMQ